MSIEIANYSVCKCYEHTKSTPDIAPPILSAHESLWTQILYFILLRRTTINWGEQTVALYRGFTYAYRPWPLCIIVHRGTAWLQFVNWTVAMQRNSSYF